MTGGESHGFTPFRCVPGPQPGRLLGAPAGSQRLLLGVVQPPAPPHARSIARPHAALAFVRPFAQQAVQVQATGVKVRGKMLKTCITRQGSVCAPLPSRHAHSFVAACARRRFTCGLAGARASAEQRGRRAGVGLPSGFRTLGGSTTSCSWPIPSARDGAPAPLGPPACSLMRPPTVPRAGVAGVSSEGTVERAVGAAWRSGRPAASISTLH